MAGKVNKEELKKFKNNETFDKKKNEDSDNMEFVENDFRVILLNNNDTCFEAVVDVLSHVFGYNQSDATEIMMSANDQGEALCWIDSRAVCEERLVIARDYCDGKSEDMHPNMPERLAYYGMLVFEIELHT